MSNFSTTFNAYHVIDKSVGYHENMAKTMLKLWVSEPQFKDVIRTSVMHHLKVELNEVEKPFTDAFDGILAA